jgi:hypothetical protein
MQHPPCFAVDGARYPLDLAAIHYSMVDGRLVDVFAAQWMAGVIHRADACAQWTWTHPSGLAVDVNCSHGVLVDGWPSTAYDMHIHRPQASHAQQAT